MRLAVHVVARAPRRPDRRMRNVDHSAAAERSLRRACPSRKLLADMTAASAEAIMNHAETDRVHEGMPA
jgi:hypothetical protein